ncbi:MAG: hypothetical protein LBI66_13005 [Burkholderiaceae bacterium]|jgi:hypothetical protein|nr:hypothetical protein [Burkholderiaceae bacterium]
MLWQNPLLRYHCHEPFEAWYWGDGHQESTVSAALRHPMCVASGERVDATTIEGQPGLVIKEMCFQMDRPAFEFLASLATRPLVFVVRDPRLSIVSRLRIVQELDGASTFTPEHSGWDSLLLQLQWCRMLHIPYLIVDTQRLRQQPERQASALMAGLQLPMEGLATQWSQRTGLQLCSPEVGALMSEVRTGSDPFYRRVLASSGIQPPDDIDLSDCQRQIDAAGLRDQADSWLRAYRGLQDDPRML